MTDDTATPEPATPEPATPDAAEPAAEAEPAQAGPADAGAKAVDPDEAMKEKYREALAHKHGAHGAAQKGHGDAGTSAHSQSAGPSQRMFRRKAGG